MQCQVNARSLKTHGDENATATNTQLTNVGDAALCMTKQGENYVRLMARHA